MGIKLLDLFSGIGGFHLGLKKAGVKIDWCGFSEIDKNAISVYKRNFPESEDLGDVRNITAIQCGGADIITFGSPCQDLSLAGKKAGLSGQRSSLFFEAIRIVNDVRPKYFIWENVKGAFSSNDGKDFVAVLEAIADIGYECQWQLLNTAWFLPQNRERIYLVGHIRGERRPEVFPIGEGQAESDSLGTGREMGDKVNTLKKRDVREPSTYIIVDDKIRRLTPNETEQLQGFEKDWTRYSFSGKELPDSVRWGLCGNAVTVDVIQAIAERMFVNA